MLAEDLRALVAALPADLRAHGEEIARVVLESDPEGFPALSDEHPVARWLRMLPCDVASDALHAHGYPYIATVAPSAAVLDVAADRSHELREYDPAERARHARRVETSAARYAKAVA